MSQHIQDAEVYIPPQTAAQRLRGLKDLVVEGVEAGTSAVERTHQSIARMPYDVLERITPIAAPVAAIRTFQEGLTASIYGVVRGVNRAVDALATLALDYAEERGR